MTPVKPIEKLCELLDENDEYYESFGNRVWWGRPIDAQTGEPINVFHNIAEPAGGDRLRVELQLATPEQAVAATVGAGTCKNVSYRVDESRFHCSECGFGCWVKNVATGRDELPAHCPNCGAKVVDE